MKKAQGLSGQRLVCLLLAMCLLAPLAAAGTCSVTSVGHHCPGHDCPVCAQIRGFLLILACLEAILSFVFCGSTRFATLGELRRLGLRLRAEASLVSLRVRMNN